MRSCSPHPTTNKEVKNILMRKLIIKSSSVEPMLLNVHALFNEMKAILPA